MSNVIMQANKIAKSFQQGTGSLPILKGVDLKIFAGDALCIVGASGAGKSTLLHILGTLDRPDSGQLFFESQNLLEMTEDQLAVFRSQTMGFVFQFHHLVSEFSALENVMLPLRIAGVPKNECRDQAMGFLQTLGLAARADHYPNQLSGGELQRVAIARALVRKPRILFADEPTGNLDSANSQLIQQLFFDLKDKMGLTLVVVTHDPNFARKFSRVMRLSDGQWLV